MQDKLTDLQQESLGRCSWSEVIYCRDCREMVALRDRGFWGKLAFTLPKHAISGIWWPGDEAKDELMTQ